MFANGLLSVTVPSHSIYRQTTCGNYTDTRAPFRTQKCRPYFINIASKGGEGEMFLKMWHATFSRAGSMFLFRRHLSGSVPPLPGSLFRLLKAYMIGCLFEGNGFFFRPTKHPAKCGTCHIPVRAGAGITIKCGTCHTPD